MIFYRSCISNNNPTDFSHGKFSRTEDVSSNIDPAGGLISRELAERLGQVMGRPLMTSRNFKLFLTPTNSKKNIVKQLENIDEILNPHQTLSYIKDLLRANETQFVNYKNSFSIFKVS